MKKTTIILTMLLSLKSFASEVPSGHTTIELSKEQQQLIGVRTETVHTQDAIKLIEAAGRVAYDPELYTAIKEYQEVLKQQSKIKDSSTDINQSIKSMLESSKLRLKLLGLSKEQIEKLSSSRDSEGLILPAKGDDLWIYADLYEMDLQLVKEGQDAVITSRHLDGDFSGRVIAVDPVINPQTRTAKVRLLANIKNKDLKPESFVDVVIKVPLGKKIVIPFNSVMSTGKESWVFMQTGDNSFKPKLIKLAEQLGDEIAVKDGLTEGDSIVVHGNFMLDSESRFKGTLLASNENQTPKCPEGQMWHAQMNHCMAMPVCPEGYFWHQEMGHCMLKPVETPKAEVKTKNTPACPKGQFWHAQMNHCMNNP